MWCSMSTLLAWTSNSYEAEAGSLSWDIAKLGSGCGSMALRDVTNTIGSYTVQIQMDKKYAPIIWKGRIIEEQANWSSFRARRV